MNDSDTVLLNQLIQDCCSNSQPKQQQQKQQKSVSLLNDISYLSDKLHQIKKELQHQQHQEKNNNKIKQTIQTLLLHDLNNRFVCYTNTSKENDIFKLIDEILDLCGMYDSFIVCMECINDMSNTSSTSSSLWCRNMCLRTIKRYLFTNDGFCTLIHDIYHYSCTTNKYYDYDNTSTTTVTATRSLSQQSNSQNNNNSTKSTRNDYKHLLEEFANMVILFPQRISTSYHKMNDITTLLPKWTTSNYYYSKVLECMFSTNAAYYNDDKNNSDHHYLSYANVIFIKRCMKQQGLCNDIAKAFYQSNKNLPTNTKNLLNDIYTEINENPKDICILMTSILYYLQMNMMQQQTQKQPKRSSMNLMILSKQKKEEMFQFYIMPFLNESCLPLLKKDEAVRNYFVQRLVLSFHRSSSSSNGSSISNKDDLPECIPYCFAHLLSHCDKDINNMIILFQHLQEVIEEWAEPVFIQYTEESHQHHITYFILSCLDLITAKDETFKLNVLQSNHDIMTGIVKGISNRLECSILPIRLDGMKVAELFAACIGQSLHFEELDGLRGEGEEEDQGDIVKSVSDKNDVRKLPPSADDKIKLKMKNCDNDLSLSSFDPDAEYISDDDDDDSENDQENADDSSTSTDDDNIIQPYDDDDDQDDIRETPRPYYLKQCLDLLRSSSRNTDSHQSYSNQLAVLQELPKLLFNNTPPDIKDLATPLTKDLLHLSNSYDIPNFIQYKMDCLITLTICQPIEVYEEVLIKDVLDSGISLGVRMEILEIISKSACILCGEMEWNFDLLFINKHKEDSSKQQQQQQQKWNKSSLVETSNPILHEKIQNIPKTRHRSEHRLRCTTNNNKTTTTNNKFGQIAPFIFYPLLNSLLQQSRNDDDIPNSIWANSDIFLANSTTTSSSPSASSSNNTNIRFLASFLTTLSTLAECSGTYPGTAILAIDLFTYTWKRIVPSSQQEKHAEIRQAVLFTLYTCISVSSVNNEVLEYYCHYLESENVNLLLDYVLDVSKNDTNEVCRNLASLVVKCIHTRFSHEVVLF